MQSSVCQANCSVESRYWLLPFILTFSFVQFLNQIPSWKNIIDFYDFDSWCEQWSVNYKIYMNKACKDLCLRYCYSAQRSES